MLINTDNNQSPKPKWLLLFAVIFFILLGLTGGGFWGFNYYYKNKIYPNLYVGNIKIGGLTAQGAKELINREVDRLSQHGVVFSHLDKNTTITPVISSDASSAYQIINFDTEKTVKNAFNYGRNKNLLVNLENKIALLWVKKRIPLTLSANRESLKKILEDEFSKNYEPAKDAGLEIKKTSAGDYKFSVSRESLGKAINYDGMIDVLLVNLSHLDYSEIRLTTTTEYPKIMSGDCLNIEAKAEAMLDLAPITLKNGLKKWVIGKNKLAEFLTLELTGSQTDKIKVGLSEKIFTDYLASEIAVEIDEPAVEAKFEINADGRVTEFQNGREGLILDARASFEYIKNMIEATTSPIDLIVKKEPTLTNADNINSFGIKEIIGIGTSNFAGSPSNRRHNIKVGADSVNGLLIKPGEEFSLLKALGDVSGATGYLPELVIKENKTIPEFGGGLCQVGTTMFRAVLNSGLPVTLRRNHSYRVSYYEPAGTDATIYDPWPDFRFINDLGTYVLVQSKISGDILSFEFWGTRDGRLVEQTKSTIYNIVKPEPAKIIETLDLKPGEKKCTEKAHNGADAYFDYKVTYPDSTVKEKRFSSHYVPWREVCLLGVEKLSAPAGTPPNATASTTPPATAPESSTN